jgi:hypothetical protein
MSLGSLTKMEDCPGDGPRILVDYQCISELTGISSNDLKTWFPHIPQLITGLEEAKEANIKLKEENEKLQNDLDERDSKAINERQGLREDLSSLRDELASARITLMDQINRRGEANNDDDEGGDNEVDEEPGIAMEDQLRIKEQSAKAIEIYTSTILSTVWQGCSRSTYGLCTLFCMNFS